MNKKINPMAESVRILLPKGANTVLRNIAKVLVRHVRQRCSAKVEMGGKADGATLTLELAVEPGIGAEGFKIVDGQAGTIRIIGNDERGVLYGIGKFLRTSRYDQGGFSASAWRDSSVPEKPLRGIYFATHFHNFYHVAPIAEVKRYIEDIGLWGYNTLLCWYGEHHFQGFDDPAAVPFRERLRAIFKAAQDIGLDVAWGDVGNAGYADSPAELRAVRVGKGVEFPCDICPSQPGGSEYILTNSARLLLEFSDVKPKYYIIWPYDNGGCNCPNCQPWGTNGYLRMAERLAGLARESVPDAKVILSTWFLTPEEFQEFQKLVADRRCDWADYAIAAMWDIQAASTGRLPLLCFPEITMVEWGPWGGCGAVPLPDRFQTEWRKHSRLLTGGFPYSEGLFDDINKVLYAQFYWDADRPAAEILNEYIAFEYSPEVVQDVTRAIAIFEQNHDRKAIKPSAEDAVRLLREAETKLTPQTKQSWRWRLLGLRALIDQELFKLGDRAVPRRRDVDKAFLLEAPEGDALPAAFEELRMIYRARNIAAGTAEDIGAAWVVPPLVTSSSIKKP